jgi:hypothetical protein
MQFSIFTILALNSIALAAPAAGSQSVQRQAAPLCTGSDSNAQCCATDVLGLVVLNCANGKRLSIGGLFISLDANSLIVPSLAANTTQFRQICTSIGQQAKCCLLPIVSPMTQLTTASTVVLMCIIARPGSGLPGPNRLTYNSNTSEYICNL